MADSRDVLLGKDSTGAEFWLVRRAVSQPGGQRIIAMRNTKKALPKQLVGMWTSGDTAQRAVDGYLKGVTAAKKAPAKKAESES